MLVFICLLHSIVYANGHCFFFFLFFFFQIPDTRNAFQRNLTRPHTEHQQKLLQGFFNNPISGKQRNVMFVTFESNGRLLFYDYYVSKDDKKHSEYYLLIDKQKIIKQIKERLLDIGLLNTDDDDKLNIDDVELKMKVFSKNTSCNKCSMEDEYIIKLRRHINSDQDLPNITEIEVQFHKMYKEIHGKQSEVHKEGMEFYEQHGIYSIPLDWTKFYAIYVQWCDSRKECVKLTSCPEDQMTHIHEVDDSRYRHIMTTIPGNFTEEQIQDELLRLAKEEPQDKMDARIKKEKQRENFVYGKDSDEIKSTQQFSGNEVKLQTTSASSYLDPSSEMDSDVSL